MVSTINHPMFEINLRVERAGAIAEANVENAETLIAAIDHIEFSLQQPVHVVAFDVVDTTPNLAAGQERDCHIYAEPATAIGGRLLGEPGDMRWNYYGTRSISLPQPHRSSDGVARARWWYLKALSPPLAIDKFLALWTSVEILAKNEKFGIRGPLRLVCNHTIEACPECAAPTSREINGPTMKAYLARYDVSDSDAATMWKLRQAVHGRNMFGPKETIALEHQLGIIRLVAFIALKEQLDLPIDQPPIAAAAGGPVIRGSMMLGGTRQISDEDIDLDRLLSTVAPS